MSFLHLVFCCLTIYNISECKIVQGITGRNVSFSWMFNKITNDVIYILHNDLRFYQVSEPKNYLPLTLPDRVKVSVNYSTPDKVMVMVDFLNITKNDSGMYRIVRNRKSQDLDESIHLKTIDETMIPKIAIARHTMLNSTLVLECRLSNPSTGEFFWRVNGSMIGNHVRYYQNNTYLSIMNLTPDDQYNLYKCNESGSGLESDPYRTKISGPNAIKFAPNITLAQEHDGLNVSCLADCYPICSWRWSKSDLSLQQDEIISTENTLHIQRITRQDAGTYFCRVQNKITGISLENFTPIQILYGPGIISFNSSDRIIQLDEKDSITISCSADCFPPCQIDWTETNADIRIPGAELKLVSVNRNYNYTCHATNARKDNATISDSIYVIVKSGISQYTTTEVASEEDTEGINYYTTRSMTSEENSEEFPSKFHLMYVLLGTGILFALALMSCLLHKIRTCFRLNRVSNSNSDDGDVSLHEENLSGNYWTIVCNANGELGSAIDTDFERHREQLLIGQPKIFTHNDSKQLVKTNDIQVIEELDGYLNPVHSSPVLRDDYIHPVHSRAIETDFKRHREQLLTGQNIVSTHNDSKQLVGTDEIKVNEELDGYLNPFHSRSVQLDDSVHHVNSDPGHTCFVSTRHSTKF